MIIIFSLNAFVLKCTKASASIPLQEPLNLQNNSDYCVFYCNSLTILHPDTSYVHSHDNFYSRLSWKRILKFLHWQERCDLGGVCPSAIKKLLPTHVKQTYQFGCELLLVLRLKISAFFIVFLAYFIVVCKGKTNFSLNGFVHWFFHYLVQFIFRKVVTNVEQVMFSVLVVFCSTSYI